MALIKQTLASRRRLTNRKGHFRVAVCLCFITRFRAESFIHLRLQVKLVFCTRTRLKRRKRQLKNRLFPSPSPLAAGKAMTKTRLLFLLLFFLLLFFSLALSSLSISLRPVVPSSPLGHFLRGLAAAGRRPGHVLRTDSANSHALVRLQPRQRNSPLREVALPGGYTFN